MPTILLNPLLVAIIPTTHLSLANPTIAGYGRTSTWNSTTVQPPSPVDSISYSNHVYDTMLFGRKVLLAMFVD